MSKELLQQAKRALAELVAQNETSLFTPKNDAPCMTNARAAIRSLKAALAAQPVASEPSGERGELIEKLRWWVNNTDNPAEKDIAAAAALLSGDAKQ